MDTSFPNLTTFPCEMLTLTETVTRELGDEPGSWIGGWMTRQLHDKTSGQASPACFQLFSNDWTKHKMLSQLILPHQKISGSADCKKEGDQDLIDLQDRKDLSHTQLLHSHTSAFTDCKSWWSFQATPKLMWWAEHMFHDQGKRSSMVWTWALKD